MRFDLPYPPSANRQWRKWRGRMVKTPAVKAYQEAAAAEIWRGGVHTFAGPVRVKITVFPPNRRRRDLDNCLKVVLDSLQAARLIGDDYQVEAICMSRGAIKVGGGLCVEVCELRNSG